MSEKMADVDKRTSQWNEVTPRSASKAVRVKSWAAVTAAAVPMRVPRNDARRRAGTQRRPNYVVLIRDVLR